MQKDANTQNIIWALGLLAFMAATRGPWLKPILGLPNASLAIFFIAGVVLKNYSYPALLLLWAGSIDYLAVQNGVSSWCITPAYLFLIPTYLSLWFAGKTLQSLNISSLRDGFNGMKALVLGASLAFLISNGSFYGLSGKFENLSLNEYITRVAHYYPGYVGIAILYVGVFVLFCNAFASASENFKWSLAR